MMAGDAQLGHMVRKLATMSGPDRAYVVERLGQDEASRLEPYLKRLEARSMSPELHALVADCTEERTPAALTPRAAAALRVAAASEPSVTSDPGPAIGMDRAPLGHRLRAWLGRR